jgi:PAS domain S-box-containing protein
MTERKRTQEALRQSEALLRRVTTSISDHIYMTKITRSAEKTNLYLSPNVEDFTGYPLEKFLEDWSFWPSTVIHPDDRQAAARQAARLAEGEDSEMEYRLVRAEGSILWVRDSGRVEKDDVTGNLIVYGVVGDVTDSKQTQEALARARDEALEASRLKTQLLANISHELRTPLSAILGFAEMLQEGMYGPIGAEQAQVTEKIIKSSTHLTKMVSQLIDLAQLEAGSLRLSNTSFIPADLIKRLESTMKIVAKNKGLLYTGHIAPDLPASLLGDSDRLHQILVNLVDNAIKFTDQGEVVVKIYRPDDRHWAIQVSDTGSGIPVGVQTNIFESFQQADGSSTRRHGGAGLGLSIVKQLTILMGGRIDLESQPGEGCKVTVLLPLNQTEEEAG